MRRVSGRVVQFSDGDRPLSGRNRHPRVVDLRPLCRRSRAHVRRAGAASARGYSLQRLLRRENRSGFQLHDLENRGVGDGTADLVIHVAHDAWSITTRRATATTLSTDIGRTL